MKFFIVNKKRFFSIFRLFPFPKGIDRTALITGGAGLIGSYIANYLVKNKIVDILKLEQNENDACYWHQRTPSDGKISWDSMNANEVLNLVRGLGGGLYDPAYCESINGIVKIMKVLVPDLRIKGTPGRVLYLNKIGPYVICKDKAILLQEYSTENNFALTSKLTLF